MPYTADIQAISTKHSDRKTVAAKALAYSCLGNHEHVTSRRGYSSTAPLVGSSTELLCDRSLIDIVPGANRTADPAAENNASNDSNGFIQIWAV